MTWTTDTLQAASVIGALQPVAQCDHCAAAYDPRLTTTCPQCGRRQEGR